MCVGLHFLVTHNMYVFDDVVFAYKLFRGWFSLSQKKFIAKIYHAFEITGHGLVFRHLVYSTLYKQISNLVPLELSKLIALTFKTLIISNRKKKKTKRLSRNSNWYWTLLSVPTIVVLTNSLRALHHTKELSYLTNTNPLERQCRRLQRKRALI